MLLNPINLSAAEACLHSFLPFVPVFLPLCVLRASNNSIGNFCGQAAAVTFHFSPARLCYVLLLQVLWGNRNVAFVVVLPLALAAEGTSWAWVAALRPQHWAAMVFIGAHVIGFRSDDIVQGTNRAALAFIARHVS